MTTATDRNDDRAAGQAELLALARRVEIRPDFPDLISPYDPGDMLRPVIEGELAKRGATLAGAGPVHIVYPHKHPGLFPGHENAALNHALAVTAQLQDECPEAEWVLADALCETVHLRRSEQQSSVHALTAKQFYVMEPRLQDGPLPFAAPAGASGGRTEYFVIVDQFSDQGTTAANLMSYIHNRGGFVLAAVTGEGSLAQRGGGRTPDVTLSARFNDAARNGAGLPALAAALAASAAEEGLRVAPDAALRTLDEKLARHGNGVFALTDGECRRLRGMLTQEYSTCVSTGWYTPYSVLMAALDAAPRAVPPPAAGSVPVPISVPVPVF